MKHCCALSIWSLAAFLSSQSIYAKDQLLFEKLLQRPKRIARKDIDRRRESLRRDVEELKRNVDEQEQEIEELREVRERLKRRPFRLINKGMEESPARPEVPSYQFQSPMLDVPLDSLRPSGTSIEA